MRFHTSLFMLLLLASSVRAEPPARDGNWWVPLDHDSKIAYGIGLFDGLGLGKNFSAWKFMHSDKPSDQKCLALMGDSFDEYTSKYLKNVTSGQLIDGLDDFYKDYRNRRIGVVWAAWLVSNGIAGTPKDELDRMIERFRRNAAQ